MGRSTSLKYDTDQICELRLRSDCSGGSGRREALHDHGFDLGPEIWITLALYVAGGQETVCPGGLGASNWRFLVIDSVITEDFGFCRIGGSDVLLAVHDALGLVKIHGFGDVIWNDGVVLPQFGDAIHLHGEQEGYAFAAQVPSQRDNRRRSPTVATPDDARSSFCFRGKNAVVIVIEQSNDAVEGLFSTAICKDPDVGVLGNGSLNLPR